MTIGIGPAICIILACMTLTAILVYLKAEKEFEVLSSSYREMYEKRLQQRDAVVERLQKDRDEIADEAYRKKRELDEKIDRMMWKPTAKDLHQVVFSYWKNIIDKCKEGSVSSDEKTLSILLSGVESILNDRLQ